MFKDEFREFSSRNNSEAEEQSNQFSDDENNSAQPFITIQSHHYNCNRNVRHHHNLSNHRSASSMDNNQSFEMVPLTVLTPYKNNSNNQILLQLNVPSSPSSSSILKRSNSSGGLGLDQSVAARPSDFNFLESVGKEEELKNTSYGDSYMLMWCPWYSMYNNLFVEFWMVRMNSDDMCNSERDSRNVENSVKLLPIRQASKGSTSERFPTGNFWSYSVGLESVRAGQEQQFNHSSVSTHYFGNELEDLIICFFGVTKIMKFKLNVTKMKVRDRKSSSICEYVIGVESVEFVELIDYDYLSRKSPLDSYSSWDSFPDIDELELDNETTQDIYQSLFRHSSQTLKTSNIPRLEFVHNDNELNFVKCDNDYNFNIYSMSKRRIESDNGNYSPISLETPQTPSTTLAIIQRSSIDLSKNHSLNVLFFQKQTTRKLLTKSPTSGRFELRSSNSFKTSFETIGDVVPFEFDTSSGGLSQPMQQPNEHVKFCKFDDNMFIVLEIDKYLLKKHEKLVDRMGAENIDLMLNTHHHVSNLPKFLKLYILDLNNPEDIKIKKLNNVKKQQRNKVTNTNSHMFSSEIIPTTDKQSLALGVEESKFVPTYKHQKSKKRASKPHFQFQHEDIFNMIVFKQDPLNNPHHYTIAIFYKVFGDRYQFNGELSDESSLKGQWFEYVHFTHVSWSKYKTLFDNANFTNRADPSLISNLGFTDIYFLFN